MCPAVVHNPLSLRTLLNAAAVVPAVIEEEEAAACLPSQFYCFAFGCVVCCSALRSVDIESKELMKEEKTDSCTGKLTNTKVVVNKKKK